VVPMDSAATRGTLADILKQCGLTLEFLELFEPHPSRD
jgi:hypothetical protein